MESKKIVIKNIRQQKIKENGLKVIFDISIKGKNYELFYNIIGGSIDSVPERCDAIVTTFFTYAMRFNLDFESSYPISEKLYYQIVYHIMPQIKQCNTGTSEISINMPLTNEKYNGTWTGTGMSCGVDSLTTFYEYSDDCKLDEYKLTHLLYFKVGAHHGNIMGHNPALQDELYEKELYKVERFCKEVNYELIKVESNLQDIFCDAFFYNFEDTHTFRNCGVMMLLQKQFKRYYYASAHNLNEFEVNVSKDTSSYEKWAMPLLTNENIEFFSANKRMTRFEKTEYISRFPSSYNNLMVCWHSEPNCGRCNKCIRTTVALDVLGKLDLYKKSFDLESYNKNRKNIFAKVVANRAYDQFFGEIYDYMKQNNMKIPSVFAQMPYHIKRRLIAITNALNIKIKR